MSTETCQREREREREREGDIYIYIHIHTYIYKAYANPHVSDKAPLYISSAQEEDRVCVPVRRDKEDSLLEKESGVDGQDVGDAQHFEEQSEVNLRP